MSQMCAPFSERVTFDTSMTSAVYPAQQSFPGAPVVWRGGAAVSPSPLATGGETGRGDGEGEQRGDRENRDRGGREGSHRCPSVGGSDTEPGVNTVGRKRSCFGKPQ